MPTTLDALQNGSTSYVYTCAIEGCKYLLTNAKTGAQAVEAWGGSGWTITKTGGSGGTWDAGASSVESFAGDCYVEVTASNAATGRTFGLSNTDASISYDTINHSLLYDGTDAYVVQSGAFPTSVAYANGDTLRVERIGSTVYYKKNGVTFYTSLVASSGSVVVDTSLSTAAATIVGIRFINSGVSVPITWQGAANVSTAYVSTSDWSLGLNGLYVDAQHEQQINPWEPFSSGGRCVLRVVQDADDTFGILVHKKGGGDETILVNELSRNKDTVTDTNIVTVKSTLNFDTSGELFIGTECIAYTGVTSTTFTGCTRGKYSPVAARGTENVRFAGHHRVGFDSQSVKLQPVVSSIPRIWNGKRVAIYIHRVVDGVLDVKDQAHRVFVGRVVETRDDPATISTVIECEHILDEIKEGTVGSDLYSAKIKAGVWLRTGMVFTFQDRNATPGSLTTPEDIEVIASGATAPYELNEGYYSLDDIYAAFTAWWAAALGTADIYGTYSIGLVATDAGARSQILWQIPGSSGALGAWYLKLPPSVAAFLGFITFQAANTANQYPVIARDGAVDTAHSTMSDNTPLRAMVFRKRNSASEFDVNRVQVYDERGTFFDQYADLLGPAPPQGNTLDGWGVFLLDNKVVVYAEKNGVDFGGIYASPFQYAGASDPFVLFDYWALPYDEDAKDYVEMRQLYVKQAPMFELLNQLFFSSGVSTYNDTTYDVLPYGLGLGLPGAALGADFLASVAGLPGASSPLLLIIDEPLSVDELLGGDLILRRAFTLWKEGHVKFGAWRAPITGDAIHTLAETNKAEPAGHEADHRSATSQTSEWARNVVKIDYNRDITEVEKNSGYRDTITIVDRTAVDDAGGRSKLFTIKARNTYGQYVGTGQGVTSLAAEFLAFMPMISRPAWKIRRSIDCRYFEGLSVGDTVLFSDEFARDPATGMRGITARPALITAHKWGLGGAQPGSDEPDPMGGEVELFFTEQNPTLQSATYAPAADVDYTASSSGFDAGYSSSETTLRCFSHHYSQITEGEQDGYPIEIEEPWDATRFLTGYKIKIIERDPLSPDAPIIWERTVASQAGNDIVLTAAISSPAWDNTKKYRVVFDDYDAVVSAQQAHAFQADDGDGYILNSGQPYLYGSGSPAGAIEANVAIASQELVELIPNVAVVEGAGRDVATDKQLMRLIDNILDYETMSAPMLFNTVLYNTTNATGYQLVAATPIYLTLESQTNTRIRYASIAPWFRSSNGTTATIRITLCNKAPYQATVDDCDRGNFFTTASWTTSSTTWQMGAAEEIQMNVKSGNGHAWLWIECSYLCETRGLARFSEGPRTRRIF
jgi:hypothetical protein